MGTIMIGIHRTVFFTGASGLVGSRALAKLQQRYPALRTTVLVRDPLRWRRSARIARVDTNRVEVLLGDLREPGLGLDPATRAKLRQTVGAIVHAAAETAITRPLEITRATNVDGTRHVIELAAEWPWVSQITHVSTAHVAGARGGLHLERPSTATSWINPYEQSKHEAEWIVRSSIVPWVILRPSTIVCESPSGAIRQSNDLHRALRLYLSGRVPVLPMAADATVDVTTADYVARAIARVAIWPDVTGQILHLCAGADSMPLDELIEVTHASAKRVLGRSDRDVPRPALVDLAGYRTFEASVARSTDLRLRHAVYALSFLVPHLALPKRFDTSRAEALLGESAPPVRAFWRAMVERLLTSHIAGRSSLAA
jgi:long-chain acyl-CoA synthetase